MDRVQVEELLDRLDEKGEVDENAFNASSELSKGMRNLKDEDRLKLYALFKQSTKGDVDVTSPSIFDLVNSTKWGAWKKLEGLPMKAAKRAYVHFVDSLAAGRNPFVQNKKKGLALPAQKDRVHKVEHDGIVPSEERIIETLTGNSGNKCREFFVSNSGLKERWTENNVSKSPNCRLWISRALAKTFLPTGYPDSVRGEYLQFQAWDSLQALCSYLRAVLAIEAFLTGAGVGNAQISALSTALAWIWRDGFGMMSSLLFAFFFAGVFEENVREWRLVADVLNNFALTLDMMIGIFPNYFLLLSSISSASKACCGIVAGATRARISAHFADEGALSDVTAKVVLVCTNK